ncbi:hypothetical protein [Natrialba swarupiae]|uniref:Uncharacterized protein n=1 Tax=Natrialba swarupiae TaxID=2448032 RepID=A0A5D5ATX9_9EURY|nr:hypothetical protein [Natrialba swarupiae]TYT62501.1 hypothetical protein FYC77_08395 [Natrialba swarupiae]
MKRRTFLSAIGAGSITAGALVGTESVSRIEAQRRVKLEVAPVMDLTGISFVAFCGEVGIESIEVLTANDEGEPVEIEWSTDDPVDEVILKGEQEWYRFDTAGATSGTAIMAEEDGGVLISPDWPNRVEGDDSNRCPPSPCKGETGTKLEYDDGFSNPEATKESCPSPPGPNTDTDGGEESDAQAESSTEPDTDRESETESTDEINATDESSSEVIDQADAETDE